MDTIIDVIKAIEMQHDVYKENINKYYDVYNNERALQYKQEMNEFISNSLNEQLSHLKRYYKTKFPTLFENNIITLKVGNYSEFYKIIEYTVIYNYIKSRNESINMNIIKEYEHFVEIFNNERPNISIDTSKCEYYIYTKKLNKECENALKELEVWEEIMIEKIMSERFEIVPFEYKREVE